MAIELNNLRVYALGLAHRAVSDISRDGFRQLRNYVDMCAFLAKTEDQQRFFDRAQTALEKTDSLYYPLIQRTLSTVSADSICTVGVNLGIDALTYGGSQLKKHAQETGKPVYWMTVADSAEGDALQPRITQGEDAGQFLWILLSRDGSVDAAQCLAGTHPKSDFGLVLPAQAITPQITARLADSPNLIPILSLDSSEITDEVHTAVHLLQSRKIFFGIIVRLTDDTIGQALDAEWLEVLSQHTLFCTYTHPGVAKEKTIALRDAIYRTRTTTGAPVVLFDWEYDTVNIGGFISPLAQVEYRAHME